MHNAMQTTEEVKVAAPAAQDFQQMRALIAKIQELAPTATLHVLRNPRAVREYLAGVG